MPTNTQSVTWPYAIKTVAIGGFAGTLCTPYPVSPAPVFNPIGAELAFEIFPPQYIYKPVGLYMSLNYTFNSSLALIDQVLQGVYVRDTPSSLIGSGFSSVENYMPLNIQANAITNTVDIELDISSLLTGSTTNVVFLRFDSNCAATVRSGGTSNGDIMNLFKLELIYQTIGIRDER